VTQGNLDFDAAGGRAGRNAGMALVADNDPVWIDVALGLLPRFFAEWSEAFDPLAEDWRAWMLEHGLWEPHHFNCWGSLTGLAIRRELIEPTGEKRPQRLSQCHAHKSPAYRRRGVAS